MKKSTMALVLLSVLMFGLAGIAYAAENPVWVNIPFSFHAGNTVLPAGEYQFNMRPTNADAGSMLKIVNRDGTICQYVLSNRIDGGGNGSDFDVLFNRYGDSYFLSKVKSHDLGTQIAKSATEKKTERDYLNASASPKPAAIPSGSKQAK